MIKYLYVYICKECPGEDISVGRLWSNLLFYIFRLPDLCVAFQVAENQANNACLYLFYPDNVGRLP